MAIGDEVPRDWHVVGRGEVEGVLLLECQNTGKLGAVHKDQCPKGIWERAENAVRHAFRWNPAWGEVTELTPSVA